MNVEQIKNIDSLIQLEDGSKILEHKVTRLTAPGENYGSLMLRVDLKTDKNEEVNVVAKMLPPNKFMQELFNTHVTFKNEIGFYKHVIPTLQSFQKEHGVKKIIDFAPKFYGGRINSDNDDNGSVDNEAVLILENLKIKNFVTLERTEGLDLDVTKLILQDLAKFHAVPLALKLQKPEVFEEKITPFLVPWKVTPDHYNKLKKDLIRLVENMDELKPMKEKIVKEFEQQMVPKPSREPFATINHNDCWSNNNMFKLDDNRPVQSKILDFQMCSYGSPARDVLFFLFSSVKDDVLLKNYDDLIKFYHTNFISVLKELSCDVKAFSFEAFLREIDFEAKNSQFAHVAFMLFAILADKKTVKEISEMTPDSLIAEEDGELLKKKFVFFVNQFLKNNWIFN